MWSIETFAKLYGEIYVPNLTSLGYKFILWYFSDICFVKQKASKETLERLISCKYEKDYAALSRMKQNLVRFCNINHKNLKFLYKLLHKFYFFFLVFDDTFGNGTHCVIF